MFKNLINIIAGPKEAFTSIREKPTVLVPLLLIALLTASVQWGYFQIVDREFLIDQLIAQQQAFVNVPEDQLRAGLENANTNTMAIQSVVGVLIVIPLIMALYAGYLALISKFTYDEIRYKQWLSLVVWTGIPSLFVAIAGWVVLLTNSGGMIALTEINPLTLNNLIFQSEGRFAGLLSGMDLTQIWSVTLMVLGYKQWTGKSGIKSASIILAPYLVIIGIIVLVILL